jgi:type VI protein secretion system component VasK
LKYLFLLCFLLVIFRNVHCHFQYVPSLRGLSFSNLITDNSMFDILASSRHACMYHIDCLPKRMAGFFLIVSLYRVLLFPEASWVGANTLLQLQ